MIGGRAPGSCFAGCPPERLGSLATDAQAAGMAIWNSAANADDDKRDYSILNPAWRGGGALIYASSIFQKFNLWIPNSDSVETQTDGSKSDRKPLRPLRLELYRSHWQTEPVIPKNTEETA